MRASDAEKSAIRELCIHKRRLSNIERDNKKKRKRWTEQKKAAREELDRIVPDGVAYKIGDNYVRREVYNRMTPIRREMVRDVLKSLESVPEGESSFVERLCSEVKRVINDGRRHRGEFVKTTKAKPRNMEIQPAPSDVLELAAMESRAAEHLRSITSESKDAIASIKTQMKPLETTVMEYMTRTRKDRQRVSISDSLSGGAAVSHGFSITRKRREVKPTIKMDVVLDSIRAVLQGKERDFSRRRSDIVREIMARLDEATQTGDVYYLSMMSGGIRE